MEGFIEGHVVTTKGIRMERYDLRSEQRMRYKVIKSN
jgi:hypothetical protein